MTKKWIKILVTIMGISIIGIIAVQLLWVTNAIRLKNELFKRTVSEALISTVTQLENQRDIMMFRNMMNHSDSLISLSTNPLTQMLNKAISGHQAVSQKVVVNQIGTKKPVVTRISQQGKELVVKIDTIESLRQLNQVYNNRISNFQQKSEQLLSELFDIEQGRTIQPQTVQQILQHELSGRGITTPFSFAIVDSDQINYISDEDQLSALKDSPFWVRLYPRDLLPKTTRLAIQFPNQKGFLLSSINWVLLTSLTLSCVILVIFTISVFMIIRQKKIADMKADFVNNMTHEFKTPIATINVASDSIVNQKVLSQPDKVKFFAEMISKENKRMNQQVENILRIARLDKKDFQLNLEQLNAHEQIKKVAEAFQLQAFQKEGNIYLELNADNPVVMSDLSHFQNIISNLLDNALKYTRKPPEVTIVTSNDSKGMFIEITDNGIGMSRSAQSKIFERFYRVPSGNLHNVKGFGLGLSYVKAIVQANSGTISLTSELNKGSSFTLFFPFTL